jgi:hypothetical protein
LPMFRDPPEPHVDGWTQMHMQQNVGHTVIGVQCDLCCGTLPPLRKWRRYTRKSQAYDKLVTIVRAMDVVESDGWVEGDSVTLGGRVVSAKVDPVECGVQCALGPPAYGPVLPLCWRVDVNGVSRPPLPSQSDAPSVLRTAVLTESVGCDVDAGGGAMATVPSPATLSSMPWLDLPAYVPSSPRTLALQAQYRGERWGGYE